MEPLIYLLTGAAIGAGVTLSAVFYDRLMFNMKRSSYDLYEGTIATQSFSNCIDPTATKGLVWVKDRNQTP